MSIIIYYTEQLLDRRQIEALRKFYNCDHVIYDYVYGENTFLQGKAIPRLLRNSVRLSGTALLRYLQISVAST